MCLFSTQPAKICTEGNKIPEQVLIDILGVYEFGEEEHLSKLPNNLICQRDGSFWTTWDRVFKIRRRNKLIREGRKEGGS